MVVNPDVVRQQVESGVIYGLSAALYGRPTMKQGAVAESNFDDQPVLRMNECPVIETHLVRAARRRAASASLRLLVSRQR